MAAAFVVMVLSQGVHHLLPSVEAAKAAPPHSNGDGWAFVRSGSAFPGNNPDYAQLGKLGMSGVLWDPGDATAAAGIASAHQAGFEAGVWLVPHQNEAPQAFARRAAAAIAEYRPDRLVLDIEAIGKGFPGSPGWQWSEQMMRVFSVLEREPPALAVTLEPFQDDFNYAAYTRRGAQLWPECYYGDMSPADPEAVVDRVEANGVPRDLIVPVLGPKQLDGYTDPHNIFTADDIQGYTPSSGAGINDEGEGAETEDSADQEGGDAKTEDSADQEGGDAQTEDSADQGTNPGNARQDTPGDGSDSEATT